MFLRLHNATFCTTNPLFTVWAMSHLMKCLQQKAKLTVKASQLMQFSTTDTFPWSFCDFSIGFNQFSDPLLIPWFFQVFQTSNHHVQRLVMLTDQHDVMHVSWQLQLQIYSSKLLGLALVKMYSLKLILMHTEYVKVNHFLRHIYNFITQSFIKSITLALLRPPKCHRHRGGWLPLKQNRHHGVLQCSRWSSWALFPQKSQNCPSHSQSSESSKCHIIWSRMNAAGAHECTAGRVGVGDTACPPSTASASPLPNDNTAGKAGTV